MIDTKVKGYRTVSELNLRLKEISNTIGELAVTSSIHPQLTSLDSLNKSTIALDYIQGQVYSNFNVNQANVLDILDKITDINNLIISIQKDILISLSQTKNIKSSKVKDVIYYLKIYLNVPSISEIYYIPQKPKYFYLVPVTNLLDIKGFYFKLAYIIILYENEKIKVKLVGSLDNEAFNEESNYTLIENVIQLDSFLINSGIYGN